MRKWERIFPGNNKYEICDDIGVALSLVINYPGLKEALGKKVFQTYIKCYLTTMDYIAKKLVTDCFYTKTMKLNLKGLIQYFKGNLPMYPAFNLPKPVNYYNDKIDNRFLRVRYQVSS